MADESVIDRSADDDEIGKPLEMVAGRTCAEPALCRETFHQYRGHLSCIQT